MKYKLIKTYPGYKMLGEIHCSENKLNTWQGTIYYDANPEYWQKVEEVDYEILSFNCKAKCINSFGAYLWNEMAGEWRNVKDKTDYIIEKFGINSVKRLSDGEVFTIGDEYFNNAAGIYTEELIHRINIVDNECRIYNNECCGYYLLEQITKLPKKTSLFTTEDGVAVFDKKTSYYLVSNDFKVCFSSWFSQADLPFKTFSTKEKAEEYILLNKPCLSIKEITDLVLNNPNMRISDCAELAIINSLKQLAKSKL